MKQDTPPLQHFCDLDRLGQAGADVSIHPKGEELVRLAKWAKVDAVERFAAEVELRRLTTTRFRLSFTLEADIVQSCVVTLEPVKSHIAREFLRELHLVAARHEPEGGSLTLDAAEDEVPEEIESPHYDLAAPLLEEFVLAIDPYPRAPGAAFEPPDEGGQAKDNPFAVLKSLKKGS